MASICKKCSLEVKTNHNGIACELCGKWYHTKCVGISSETYKFLKSCSLDGAGDYGTPNNGGVMWFCHDCLGPASQIIKNVSHIQKRQEILEEDVKQAARRIDDIESKSREVKTETDRQLCENKKEIQEMQRNITDINTKLHFVEDELAANGENRRWTDIVSQAVDSKLETVSAGINMVEKSIEETRKKAQEVRDKEDRRNNIILYKVPECQPGSYEEIIKHDSEYFVEMCNEALGLDLTREDMKRIQRLGRRSAEPRPLLIQLSSGMLKNHIMETTFNLRKSETFRHVIVSHDMTKTEREQCKQLVAEAKQRELQEGSGEYVFRVRGQPGEMRIVKLKKRI